MPKKSAGLLVYRTTNGFLEVFLGHPGGPYYTKKDLGCWTIPKGEFGDDEKPLDAARREFNEEIGVAITGEFTELSPVKLRSGKTVYAWAVEGDIDPTIVKSNAFQLEFPPRSGQINEYPEIDRAAWFTIPDGRNKIIGYQMDLLTELLELLVEIDEIPL